MIDNRNEFDSLDEVDVFEYGFRHGATGKNRTQPIVIHYRFVGVIDFPDAPKTKHTLYTRHGVAVTYEVA